MLLMSLILLPVLGALMVAWLHGRAADWVASLTVAGALGLAVAAVVTGPAPVVLPVQWLGAAPGLRLDGLGGLLALVVTSVGLGIAVYSAGYFSDRNRDHPGEAGKGRYYFFLLLFVAAMLGLALAPDFGALFVFWELTTICSWALISHYGSREAVGAGLKALAVTQFASLFFVGGLLALLTLSGSVGFGAVRQLPGGWQAAFVVMMLIAAWGKAAQAPFYTWLPSAMAAPTPASAFLHAAAMVKAGIFLTARVLVSAGVLSGGPALLAGGAALVTLYVGVLGYFYQDDLKRLLAFSTICNLALMLLGLALAGLGSQAGLEGALLHLWSHAFTKSLLFLAVGAMAYATGVRTIGALQGVMRSMPLTAAAFLMGALAISGLPPFGVFWSKLLLLRAAVAVGGVWGWSGALLVLVESGLSLAWFLWVAHRVIFGPPSSAVAEGHDPPRTMGGVLVGLMAMTLAAPYVGIPLVRWVTGG
ncbi:MAG TPA: hydrogenase 4 subunit D [Symbiobacteriaceae bacterium]|nr:hydrogenase 4 subunit D [Symbiobacteriaceae bacterium]